MTAGTDYGAGQTNIDLTTGIRYGVIHPNDVCGWSEAAQVDFGLPHCPQCGFEFCEDNKISSPAGDYFCPVCEKDLTLEEAIREEPLGYYVDVYNLKAYQFQGRDIFITASDYYTRCQFCSPCAPGAGYLMSPTTDGPKTYCFGHWWFDGGKAPYPVFRVSDDSEVLPD